MDFYGITQSELSQKVEYPREMINRVYNDKQDVSKNLLKKVTETYTSLSADWIINGTGQMLKSENFDEKKEAGRIEGNATFFSTNIEILCDVLEASWETDIAPRLPNNNISHPSLRDGAIGPTLGECIIIKELLGVSLDDLLFRDFRLPENMKKLKQALEQKTEEAETEMQVLKKQMQELTQHLQSIAEEIKTIKGDIKKMKQDQGERKGE